MKRSTRFLIADWSWKKQHKHQASQKNALTTWNVGYPKTLGAMATAFTYTHRSKNLFEWPLRKSLARFQGNPSDFFMRFVILATKKATIFWASQGVILIGCLQNGMTIAGFIDPTRCSIVGETVLFAAENSALPLRQCTGSVIRIIMSKLNELPYEVVSHPPFSSEVAPSDFFLFPNFKKLVADLETSNISDGLKRLKHSLKKYIDLWENEIEKQK